MEQVLLPFQVGSNLDSSLLDSTIRVEYSIHQTCKRTKMEIKKQIELIRRGAEEIIPEDSLREKLEESEKTGRPLRVKLGADPTAPDLHLGHYVVLRKLRDFQEAGHKVVFIIGDFTARIGDPSGKSQTRPPLSPEEIDENAKTYSDQLFRVLDPDQTELVRNSEWLGKMGLAETIRLTASFTVARILERDDFQTRYRAGEPISLHEFLYPLLQGWDSVCIRADVEVGGTDQKFNLLVGRDLQERDGQNPQVILTMPLLVGTDGSKKMSKSLGNYIAFNDEPFDVFGKIMSIPDDLMWDYYRLVTRIPQREIERAREEVEAGKMHPMEAKRRLAEEVTATLHSAEEAQASRQRFETVFSKRSVPDDMPEYSVKAGETDIISILRRAEMVSSNSEARRLLRAGAVKLNNKMISEGENLELADGDILKVGKRRFLRVRLK